MSVLIAFVRFKNSEQSYPVNCHRVDLGPGDEVYVKMPAQRVYKLATIERVAYQGWACVNTIVGRRDEASRDAQVGWCIVPGPNARFTTIVDDVGNRLRARGWKGAPTVASNFRYALWNVGRRSTAFILIRARGLNFVLRDSTQSPELVGRKVRVSATEGRCVSHWYNGASENINDLALAFAQAFDADAGADAAALDRFFVPQGGAPSRPPRRRGEGEDELASIYDAISDGSGGPAYLGDGLSLGPGGSWIED